MHSPVLAGGEDGVVWQGGSTARTQYGETTYGT